ncbi:uncharacterized protein A4U43_C10F50 [Asparagus officinalis]|uniref:GDSL esterase/lipase n=1 Tax=Asparagus officinalis TaxID=4686 RepID=A0A5P1DZG7_ASPOF|nr:GDSL esterase/lipase At1g71691-like [Asparagus officinalis]ONK55694.1 uncharacterized protein A4U43_C10F50 [Asparagus officinalis]
MRKVGGWIWLLLAMSLMSSVIGGAEVPAMFVFGDSLVDPGNNNNLTTLAKANYKPNGVDFPEGVTGRFCNGGTVADHLGFRMGLPLIPPYNNPNTVGSKILQGVNYASAASGILNETGTLFGQLFPLDEQIQNFGKTLEELNSLLGGDVGDYLKNSLYFVCVGNNDYLNNYLLPLSNKPKKYTPETFADLLLHHFNRQLKDLYNLGGRKFLITGLGPLGCIPEQIGNSGNTSSCVESTNHLASVFNSKLKAMLDQLNIDLDGSYFLYWDTYSSTLDVITNYSSYGFKYQHKACCGAGRAKGQIICLPVLPLKCHDRRDFVFWDPYHPTDAFNVIASRLAYQGNLQHSFPRNVQELIES